MRLILSIVLSAIVFISCQKNTPSVDDNEVTEMVISKIKETVHKRHFNTQERKLIEADRRDAWISSHVPDRDKENEINLKIQDGYYAKLANEYADGIIKNIKWNISTIRLIESNENTRKIQCEAELNIEDSLSQNEHRHIHYSAQYTTDDKLYIEVYGF